MDAAGRGRVPAVATLLPHDVAQCVFVLSGKVPHQQKCEIHVRALYSLAMTTSPARYPRSVNSLISRWSKYTRDQL